VLPNVSKTKINDDPPPFKKKQQHGRHFSSLLPISKCHKNEKFQDYK
jgi:hypothetical protein